MGGGKIGRQKQSGECRVKVIWWGGAAGGGGKVTCEAYTMVCLVMEGHYTLGGWVQGGKSGVSGQCATDGGGGEEVCPATLKYIHLPIETPRDITNSTLPLQHTVLLQTREGSFM